MKFVSTMLNKIVFCLIVSVMIQLMITISFSEQNDLVQSGSDSFEGQDFIDHKRSDVFFNFKKF